MKVLVAITGASGAILGIDFLQCLQEAGITTHLILSDWGEQTICCETDWRVCDVEALAQKRFSQDDMFAAPASGSAHYDAMVVVPCSMKTLAAISHDYADTLLTRAASVMLKERRTLVLVARETPLSSVQLRNMHELSVAGATIMPPVPAFYRKPDNLADLVRDFSLRLLDFLGIESTGFQRWGEWLVSDEARGGTS